MDLDLDGLYEEYDDTIMLEDVCNQIRFLKDFAVPEIPNLKAVRIHRSKVHATSGNNLPSSTSRSPRNWPAVWLGWE